jgi:hypothetical protein
MAPLEVPWAKTHPHPNSKIETMKRTLLVNLLSPEVEFFVYMGSLLKVSRDLEFNPAILSVERRQGSEFRR